MRRLWSGLPGSWIFDIEMAWMRLRRQSVRVAVSAWAVAVAVAAVLFVLALGNGLHTYLSERLQQFTPALWVAAPPRLGPASLPATEAAPSTPPAYDPVATAPSSSPAYDPATAATRSTPPASAASPAPPRDGDTYQVGDAGQRLDHSELRTTLLGIPGVAAVSRRLQGHVLISSGTTTAVPAQLDAYDTETMATVLPGSDRFVAGRLPRSPGEIAAGVQLARALGARVGDTLRLTAPGPRATHAALVGLFEAGFAAVDAELLLTGYQTAHDLFGGDGRFGWAVGVAAGADLERVRLDIQTASGLWVQPWYEGNQALLESLAVEAQVMFWISLAAVLTAAFAGAGIALLRMMERRFELGVLQAVGATSGNILRTVLVETVGAATFGAVIGGVLGWTCIAALARYPIPLPPRFGLAYLPVQPALRHFVLATCLTVAATALAALAPAIRAARTDPVSALRGHRDG